jgi:hypothetical protein
MDILTFRTDAGIRQDYNACQLIGMDVQQSLQQVADAHAVSVTAVRMSLARTEWAS